mmetsp:Transcript_34758/g.99824  ORF Transcript_34758/g.99824 Transcript_34758/m.99824 type:complete len:193 (-) Transcript_34758:50-628(-)
MTSRLPFPVASHSSSHSHRRRPRLRWKAVPTSRLQPLLARPGGSSDIPRGWMEPTLKLPLPVASQGSGLRRPHRRTELTGRQMNTAAARDGNRYLHLLTALAAWPIHAVTSHSGGFRIGGSNIGDQRLHQWTALMLAVNPRQSQSSWRHCRLMVQLVAVAAATHSRQSFSVTGGGIEEAILADTLYGQSLCS